MTPLAPLDALRAAYHAAEDHVLALGASTTQADLDALDAAEAAYRACPGAPRW